MNKKTIVVLLFIVGWVFQSVGQSPNLRPPIAKIISKADTLHGDIRVDNYFWIRDRSNPEVIKYLEAENAYTDSMMKNTIALQETLYNEMLRRIKETDLDVPYREQNYYYYTRTEQDKQYPIYCRKKERLEASEEIILDQNELAKSFRYLRLGAFSVCPDQSMLAYSLDTNGSEHFNLSIKNLNDGSPLSDRIPDMVSIVWAMDNKTLFYTTRDSAWRPYRLYRHILGTDPSLDELIYEEQDALYDIFAYRSKSNEFIFLVSSASTSDEVRYIPAYRPMEPFKVILSREPEHEYAVDHHGEHFYIRTNKGAKNFRLVKAPIADPQEKNWIEVLPHRQDVTLEGVEFFANYYVVFEREKGLQKMRVTDMRTGRVHYIEFPEPVYSAFNNVNRVFDTNVFRFSYQSFITPNSIYDYNMDTRLRTLMKQTEVLGGYDPSIYQSERIYATASDGKQIPISLVYKKGMKREGNTPLHLTGYGSYGASSNVTFSSNRLSLLNRGISFAVAHIRGGGDMGREWRDDGKMLKKKNTFTDFIVCAEHLIKEQYTSPEQLTMEGGSAGGLLMGAVTTMRPDLFKAVVAHVPFVDVLNTMLDASIPLTVGEYLEWGNPNEKVYYEYMKSYCPYTNVTARDYPNILVKVGLNDPRVGYWEGTKWAAKLRAMKTDDNIILLKCNMGTGHGGSSGRYDRLKEIAFDYAYIITQHNIKE
ncbi:MAG: S9 family peptidase [Ignavibacteriae bacterium]|nr:S9 family peptidase [Ignavibacteriota bacterium]